MPSAPPVDLIGPKGYTHGWVYHGPGPGTRLHTSRLVRRDVSRQQGRLKNASPGLIADRASAALRGKKGSDYQHLAAARLHAAAARQAATPELRSRHAQMARMHRGIAARNVGRQVRSEGRMIGFAVPHAETAGGRKSALKRGLAIAPPSKGGAPGFPVTDPEHWEKARRAIGRVKNPARRAAVARLLRKTAPKFGKTAALRESWAAPGGSSHANPMEFAAWEHELRGKGGKWASTAGGRGIRTDKPPARQMSAAELRSHLAEYHGGAPMPPGLRGTSRSARGKAAMVAAHEHMHSLLAGGGSRGNEIANQGVGHSHGQSSSYASTGPAMEFAMRSLPVSSPYDLVITRADDGSALVRHRRGGGEIARIRRTDDGTWVAAIDGRDLEPHARQRGALLQAISTHNTRAGTPYHRPAAEPPLQPPPVQTDLMKAYGIPAIRALASSSPVVGAGDGPRTTEADGLNPRGKTIYAKLRKRNFPHARAHSFARRAQNRVGRK